MCSRPQRIGRSRAAVAKRVSQSPGLNWMATSSTSKGLMKLGRRGNRAVHPDGPRRKHPDAPRRRGSGSGVSWTAACAARKQPTLNAWRFADGDVAVLTGHTDDVMDFTFVPALGRFASTSRDRTLRLWAPSTHTAERVFHFDRTSLRIASMHRRPVVALATEAGDVLLYDVDRGREVWSITAAVASAESLCSTTIRWSRLAVATESSASAGKSADRRAEL
jgi:WD40 repeat protein